MDERVLNELLECSVCLEMLDERSKVLPCQHTFCHRCLEDIVDAKSELRCPECRALVEIPVEDLPSNILLIRLLDGMKNIGQKSGSPKQPGSPMSTGNRRSYATSRNTVGSSHGSQPCARALYNYDSMDPGDLSFKKGNIVILRRKVDDNWFHGELNGKHGFFPKSYVQVLTPLPDNTPKCKALYNFEISDKNEKDCLVFHKDDVLTVIRRVDDNWAEGILGDKIGIFPISFVELNDAAKDLLSKSSSKSNTSSSNSGHSSSANSQSAGSPHNPSLVNLTKVPTSQKRHSLTPMSTQSSPPVPLHHRHSLELFSTSTPNGSPSAAPAAVLSTTPQVQLTSATSVPKVISQTSQGLATTPTTPSGQTLGPPPSSPPPPPPPLYVALYNYRPKKDDEIELKKNEHYRVTERCQDGWFKGICLRTNKVGVFPGNYVQLLVKHAKAGPPSSSSRNTSPLPGGSSSQPSSSQSSPQLSSGPSSLPMRTCSSQPASLDYQVRTSPSSSMASLTPPPPPQQIPALPPRSPSAAPQLFIDMPPVLTQAPPPGSLRRQAEPTHLPLPDTEKRTPVSSSRRNSAPAEPIYVALPVHRPSSASGERQSSPRTSHSRSSQYNKPLPAAPATPSRSSDLVMSTCVNVTPPNVVIGGAGSSKEKSSKKEHKEKERSSFMKKFRSSKSKSSMISSGEGSSGQGGIIVHTRSGSLPVESLSFSHPKKISSSDMPSSKPARPQPLSQSKPTRPKPLARERYRCMVPYPPQSDLELELSIGDIVYVHKRREDGWYKGTLQKNGKTGLFPGSFVESF